MTTPSTHDFVISIKSIEFDFSGTDWAEEHETEREWENYQQELTSKYRPSGFQIIPSDADTQLLYRWTCFLSLPASK